MRFADLERRVVLERLVIGLEEPILVKGAGPMTAKVDSGNGGYNVIHGEDLVLQGAELSFKTVTDNGERRMQATVVDTIDVNIGSGNIQQRPVIELDVKFAGEDYKRVRFSVADRAANSEKVLISKDFIDRELHALIDVGASNISNDNVQAELVTESSDDVQVDAAKDGAASAWSKTKDAASTIAGPALKAAKGVGGALAKAGEKMQSFSRWCDNFAHGRGGWGEIFSSATGKVVLGTLAAGAFLSNPAGAFLLGASLAKGALDFGALKGWVSSLADERDTEARDRESAATRIASRSELWQRHLVARGLVSEKNAAGVVEDFAFRRVATFSADTDAHGGKPSEKVFPDFYRERWREMSAFAKGMKVKNEAYSRGDGRLLLESLITESSFAIERDDFLKKSSQDIAASVKAKAEEDARQAGRANAQEMFKVLTKGGRENTQPLLAELVNGDLAGKLKAEEEDRAAGRLGEFSSLSLAYLNGPSPDVKAAVDAMDRSIADGRAQKYGQETRQMVENCNWTSIYLVDFTHNGRALDAAYDAVRPALFQAFSNILSNPVTVHALRAVLTDAANKVTEIARGDGKFGPCSAFFAVAQGRDSARAVTLLEPAISNEGSAEGGAYILNVPEGKPEGKSEAKAEGKAEGNPKGKTVATGLDALDADALLAAAANTYDFGRNAVADVAGIGDIDSLLASAAREIVAKGGAALDSTLADISGLDGLDADAALAVAAERVLGEEKWQGDVEASKGYADLSGISPFTSVDMLLMQAAPAVAAA